jgi:hypothetical protein
MEITPGKVTWACPPYWVLSLGDPAKDTAKIKRLKWYGVNVLIPRRRY